MYTLYKFHFLNGISEINQLFDDILIIWPAPVYNYNLWQKHLWTSLVDNLAAKETLEKSWVHNNCITFYLQIKVNKCTTKSGKMSHIALCIAQYIHEKPNKYIYILYN